MIKGLSEQLLEKENQAENKIRKQVKQLGKP